MSFIVSNYFHVFWDGFILSLKNKNNFMLLRVNEISKLLIFRYDYWFAYLYLSLLPLSNYYIHRHTNNSYFTSRAYHTSRVKYCHFSLWVLKAWLMWQHTAMEMWFHPHTNESWHYPYFTLGGILLLQIFSIIILNTLWPGLLAQMQENITENF